MLRDYEAHPTLPATDFARARKFYEQTLGFKPVDETPGGVRYECAKGTGIFVYPGMSGAASGNHTQVSFMVDNIEKVVADLKSKGVKFEEYDMPDLKTVDGVADDPGGGRGAWFKDTEGNLLAIVQEQR